MFQRKLLQGLLDSMYVPTTLLLEKHSVRSRSDVFLSAPETLAV